jgi:hypothetical protein
MEFEELKKVWDNQNQQHVFALDQSALQNRVQTKQRQGRHISHWSEVLLIGANLVSSIMIMLMMVSKGYANISLIIMAAWMFLSAMYVTFGRAKRIRNQSQFDRSLHGALQSSITLARYQVRLATLGRWSAIPIGVLSTFALIEAHQSFWIVIALVIFLLIANYASGWETRIYVSRMRELEALKRTLEKD